MSTQTVRAVAAPHPAPANPLQASFSPVRAVVVFVLTLVAVSVTAPAAAHAMPGLPVSRIAVAFLVSVLPALVVFDLYERRLPNVFVGSAGLLLLAGSVLDLCTGHLSVGTLLVAVATGVVGFLALLTLALVSGGIGMGDVKLTAVVAYALALHSPVLALVAALAAPPLLALIPGLVLAAVKGRDASFPYGVAIAAAALAALVAPGFLLSLIEQHL